MKQTKEEPGQTSKQTKEAREEGGRKQIGRQVKGFPSFRCAAAGGPLLETTVPFGPPKCVEATIPEFPTNIISRFFMGLKQIPTDLPHHTLPKAPRILPPLVSPRFDPLIPILNNDVRGPFLNFFSYFIPLTLTGGNCGLLRTGSNLRELNSDAK